MNAGSSWVRRLDETGAPFLIARIVLALTFIYMGSMKLGEPIEFLKQIRLYHMLPESPPIFLNAAAIVLPWLEIVAGVALLIGLRFQGAAAAVAILLLIFTPAILIRGLQILAEKGGSFFSLVFDCGCGSGPVVIWTKILANLGLLALAILVLLSRSRKLCLSSVLDRRTTY